MDWYPVTIDFKDYESKGTQVRIPVSTLLKKITAAKQAAFIMAYADTDPKEAEPMVSHYKTLLNYLGWKDRGMVIAPGMWPAGAVQNTKYSRQAYKLGKSL